MSGGLSRAERTFVRTVAIFVLLLLAFVPVSFVVSVWTGDWRWFITSVPAALLGILAWIVVRTGVKA